MTPTARQRTPMLALLAADGISRLGNAMTMTAIPWFVLVTTGSAARTGMVIFAGAFTAVLSLLFGGVLVDRVGFRTASIVGDLASGLSVASIPLLDATVGLEFWQLLVLVFTGELLDTPAQVARYSALPRAAALAGTRFERVNSASDALFTLGSLAGPALAGVLIVAVGPANVLWLDAVSFLISIVLVKTLVPADLVQPAGDGDAGYCRQFREGMRFIRQERLLFPLILLLAVMNVLIGPIDVLIVPVYAKEVFDSAYALGLMAAAGAVGSLLGNVVFGWAGHRLSRRAVFFFGFISLPAVLLSLSSTPGLAVTLAVLAGLGFGLSLTNLLEYTIYFERIPEGMRARVLGLAGAIGWCTVPVGRLTGGGLIEAFGLPDGLLVLGLAALPLPFVVWIVPGFRDMRAPQG
jgi:MFS family permease